MKNNYPILNKVHSILQERYSNMYENYKKK